MKNTCGWPFAVNALASFNSTAMEKAIMELNNLSSNERLSLAMDHYFANWTGPYPGGHPAQPSITRSSVEEDGIVTLRNSFRMLAKMRVSDNGQVEELDFDPSQVR
ncbi:MAG TPA: hypothetical protein VH575_32165 [Gemmataceae bacterium]